MVPEAPTSDVRNAAICWCCGHGLTAGQVVSLGNHPEVEICLPCAHFLHRQACAHEDAMRPSPAAHIRDRMRAARNSVIRRGWHRKPVIGRTLRWLGRHTP